MKNNNFKLTTKELAAICGVSQGTVDRALNGRDGINAETKEKILRVAQSYGYSGFEGEQPKLIGIVVFDLYNEYFSELVMNIEQECRENGYSLVVMFTDKDEQTERRCIKQLYYMGVSGIILCPVGEGEEYEKFLSALNIPILTVGNKLPHIRYVGVDNRKAMYDATVYLSQGHRKMIYYSPALKAQGNIYAQSERMKGFVDAAEELGIVYRVIMEKDELFSHLSYDGTWAVMCSTDYYMSQIVMRYPNVAVMGFDNIGVLKLFDRELPSVDCDSKAVARRTVKALGSRGTKDIYVLHKLIT